MWEALEKRGYPEETIETTLRSITEATKKQYSSSLHSWWKWCQHNNVSLFSNSVQDVLKFFQEELDTKNCKFGTFNQHRSALALILPIDVGGNILVRRFLKGVYRLRPPKPKYHCTWDPIIVLNYIKTLPSNDDLSLLTLSQKLVTLLALATGQRIQTLHLIKVENIIIDPNGIKIHIPEHIKTSSVRSYQPLLDLPYFEENNICVATTLVSYIERTESYRNSSEEYLLLSSKEPYKRATKSTIARWIKTTLKHAGINTDIFSAHSTRHAVTSAANRAGVSWDTIRKTAGWSVSSLTFAKFYNRPLSSDQNTVWASILQQIL